MKLNKYLALVLSLMLLAACTDYPPACEEFEVGDMVIIKLTQQRGQLVSVDGLSARECYVRIDNPLASVEGFYPFELEAL